MEQVLGELLSMSLTDQDRVQVVIEDEAVQQWLLNPRFGALLIHGNGRRPVPICPTSVACALLVHVFSKRLHFPTLYWFCGLHNSGPRGNPVGMLRSLVCQLLRLSCCQCSDDDHHTLDTQDVRKLLKLFQRLIRDCSGAFPVVCILDGVSFYESRHSKENLCRIISSLATLARSDPPKLILLLSSPIRTCHISRESDITRNLRIAEVSDHVSGAKQGLDSRQIMSATESRARRFSESLGSRRKSR